MGQKVNCNPQKLASIVSYLQRSRTAHNIKDLEKHLPSVASINNMQVKDYLQTLQDENKICAEKIGSGNWYWSFASNDKKTRLKALEDAQISHQKATLAIEDLKIKLAEVQAQREDEVEMLDSGAESREELSAAKTELEKEVKELEKQLAAYSDTDPTELERRKEEIGQLKADVGRYTDDIYSLEGWYVKSAGCGKDEMASLRREFYVDELDEEDGILKEI